MKKLMITLLLCCVSPAFAMDNTPSHEELTEEIDHTLPDEEFKRLIDHAGDTSVELIQEKSTYNTLLQLIRAHEQYKGFDPNIPAIIPDHDISHSSDLIYRREIDAFAILNERQKTLLTHFSHMELEKTAYKSANKILKMHLGTLTELSAKNVDNTLKKVPGVS